MPTAEEIRVQTQLAQLLPGLSVTSFYREFKKGNIDGLIRQVENLYLEAQRRAGIKNPSCTNPITFCDILNLLKLLGWFGPAAEFVPPPGVEVENINIYLPIPADEFRSVCWGTGKDDAAILDEFQVDPLNLTAEDSVRLIQKFEVARIYDEIAANSMFSPVNNCDDQPGSFTVVEHITIPPMNTLTLILTNTDRNSPARVHITGKLWRMR